MNYKKLVFETHFLLSLIVSGLMLILTYYAYTADQNSFLSSELIEIKGVVSKAYKQDYSNRSDLVIVLKNDSIHYYSSSPYPSKFKYKSKTLSYLPESVEVVLTLEKKGVISEPKQNWKKIVGLRTLQEVHLDPVDHKKWYIENCRLGKWIGPIVLIIGIIILYTSFREACTNDTNLSIRIKRENENCS